MMVWWWAGHHGQDLWSASDLSLSQPSVPNAALLSGFLEGLSRSL